MQIPFYDQVENSIGNYFILNTAFKDYYSNKNLQCANLALLQ